MDSKRLDSKRFDSHLEAYESELLRKCKLNKDKKETLFRVLARLRKDANSADDLIRKFGKKCYKHVKPARDQFEQAKIFCETAFGDKDQLYSKGPEEAFNRVVMKFAKDSYTNSSWEFEFGKYWIGRKLGVGGQATVRLALNTETDQTVAVKVFKPKYAKMAATEGKLLKELSHPNIISVYDFYEDCTWLEDQKTTVMVMEFAERGELIEYLMYTGKFEPDLAQWIFREILQAVKHIHSKDIAHRDMKPDNCLLALDKTGNKKDFVVKINDFGFSKDMSEIGDHMKSLVGTPRYAAPELLQGKPYTVAVDIFAMGVMLFVTLSGTQPFVQADRGDFWYSKVIKRKWHKFWGAHTRKDCAYSFPNHNNVRELIQGMIEADPNRRMTLRDILRHPWVTNTDKLLDRKAARKKLEKRFEKMDKKIMAASAQKGETRAIPWKADDKTAPPYHTDEPEGSLWFYSNDPPRGILFRLNGIIRDSEMKGKTDCHGAISEAQMDEFDAADEKKKKEAEERRKAGLKDADAPTEPAATAPTKTPSSEEEDAALEAAEEAKPRIDEKGNPVLRPMGGYIDSEKFKTCEERMEHGIFTLNFSCTVMSWGGGTLNGRIQVFSCPSDPKRNIVKFITIHKPGVKGDIPHAAVYKWILQNGGSRLMVPTATQRKELQKLAKKQRPNLDIDFDE